MSGIREQQPPVPLEGRSADATVLPRLLTWLSRAEWSGALTVAAHGVERRIFLAHGRITTASSTDPAESLAARLVHDGVVTQPDVDQAAAHLTSADRGHAFGRQLVRLRLLDDAALAAAERRRVVALAEAIVAVGAAEYRCASGAAAADAWPSQALEVPRIVATGVLSGWDEEVALASLGGPDAVLDIVPEGLNEYEATGADEAYDLTVLRANGRRTVTQVLAASPLPPETGVKFLAACQLLSCVRVVPGATGAAAQPLVDAAPPEQAPRPAARTTPAPARPEHARAEGGGDSGGHAPADRPVRDVEPDSASPRARWWLVALLAVALLALLALAFQRGWSEVTAGGAAAP